MILMSQDTPANIKHYLSDVGRVTTELPHEVDFEIIGSLSVGVQRKTVGDLLGSIASGRLYEQMRGASEKYDACIIIVEGPFGPTPNGHVKTFGFETRWQYQSVIGILISFFLHGIGILQVPNEYATSLALRSIHNQLTGSSKFKFQNPKIKSFFKIREPVKVLCAFRGINVELADRIWAHHNQLANFFLDLIALGGKSTLKIPNIGNKTVQKLIALLNEPYKQETQEDKTGLIREA